MAADVYRAIGDPTRRAILDILAERERPVEEIVAQFAVSFSAVSQHLNVLLEAGLVGRRADGRRRLYRTLPRPLQQVYDWTARRLRQEAPTEPRLRILRLAAQERQRSGPRILQPTG